jgi:mono/diheme cytochrome c family protein
VSKRCKGNCVLPLLAALAAGCGQPDPADRPVPANEVKDFGQLYSTHCAGCHGGDGKLGPAPPLNDPLFLTIVPDEVLTHVISEGRGVSATQKTPMPAFRLGKGASLTDAQLKVWAELKEERRESPKQQGPLTAGQVKVLAEGIKRHWPARVPAGSKIPPYLAPTGSSGNKDDGAKVFTRACGGCHGSHGQGGKYGERQIGAINDPAFLALISDQALRRYAITGRPDFGMPAFDGKAGRRDDFQPLTSAEIQDLVALLAFWRQSGPANEK